MLALVMSFRMTEMCCGWSFPLRRAPGVMVEYMQAAEGATPAAGG